MRVTYALQALVAASTATAAYNPQYIVLGTDGTEVADADPSLYFQAGRDQLYQLESEQEVETFGLNSKQDQVDELPIVLLPSNDEPLPEVDSSEQDGQHLSTSELPGAEILATTDEDEFSSTAVIPEAIPPESWTIAEDTEIPGVYGSVIFAELSCCFVAFIGYLMSTIPLWVGFSRGQKCCIVVAFSLAVLYQFATVGWFVGVVTPEFMLGLSSLITRMISLGMVPLTTTSFMCRAREICQGQAAATSSGFRKASHSRNSRRHRARSS